MRVVHQYLFENDGSIRTQLAVLQLQSLLLGLLVHLLDEANGLRGGVLLPRIHALGIVEVDDEVDLQRVDVLGVLHNLLELHLIEVGEDVVSTKTIINTLTSEHGCSQLHGLCGDETTPSSSGDSSHCKAGSLCLLRSQGYEQ
jgi:hypothetical protein